jgi:hypothetical protein
MDADIFNLKANNQAIMVNKGPIYKNMVGTGLI